MACVMVVVVEVGLGGVYYGHMVNRTTAKRILFVCMGNICRSPAGEGVMKQLVSARELEDRVEVDSSGTISYHVGHPADARMRQAASKRGYRLDSIARQFHRDDFDAFDLILAMDRSNLEDLRALGQDPDCRAELRLFGSFLPDENQPDVPDPYYGGVRGFDQVLDMMEQACPRILDHLLG